VQHRREKTGHKACQLSARNTLDFLSSPLNLIKNYITFTIFHKNETNHPLLSDLSSNVHLLSLLCVSFAELKCKWNVQGKIFPSTLVKYTAQTFAVRSQSGTQRAVKNASLVVRHITGARGGSWRRSSLQLLYSKRRNSRKQTTSFPLKSKISCWGLRLSFLRTSLGSFQVQLNLDK